MASVAALTSFLSTGPKAPELHWPLLLLTWPDMPLYWRLYSDSSSPLPLIVSPWLVPSPSPSLSWNVTVSVINYLKLHTLLPHSTPNPFTLLYFFIIPYHLPLSNIWFIYRSFPHVYNSIWHINSYLKSGMNKWSSESCVFQCPHIWDFKSQSWFLLFYCQISLPPFLLSQTSILLVHTLKQPEWSFKNIILGFKNIFSKRHLNKLRNINLINSEFYIKVQLLSTSAVHMCMTKWQPKY